MNRSLNCKLKETTVLAAVLWALLSFGSGLADDADSSKTASSITRALVESYAKRQALCLEYRFTSSAMGAVPAGQYVRRILAADRQGHFFLDNGHGHESMALADDPYRKMSFVCPTGTQIFMPLDRVVEKYPPPVPIALLRALPGEIVFLLGWWPFVDAPEQEVLGRKRSIEALKDDDLYILQPQTDIIDGHLCDVIEIPNVDSMWVDTTNGHVIRRRELFDKETGALALRIEYGDYRRIGIGVQMPMSIRISDFDYASQLASDRERCLNRIDFQILHAQSNEDVDVSAMDPVLLPGTIQRVRKDEYELTMEGEEDHARSIVLWGRKQLDSSGNQSDSRSLSLLRPSLLFLSVGLAVGCLVLLVRFYFRARPSNDTL